MSQYKNRLEVFHEENGGDCVLVNGWYVYSNGARRDENPVGALIDPPADPFERAKLQVAYHSMKVNAAVKKLIERQDHWRNHALCIEKGTQANDLGPYKLAEIASELEALKQEVEKRRGPLAEAQALMEANAPQWYRDQLPQTRATRQADNQQAANAITAVLDRHRI
jgi:hypothetical protein